MWSHTRCCCCCIYIQVWACVTSSDTNTMECRCGQYLVLGLRCDVSTFDLRRSMCRPSMIDVSTFDDRCVDFRRSMGIYRTSFQHNLHWFINMCWPSEIDVSTFEDRCVDLRRSMCRPSKINLMVDVKLCCYTCSKHWYYSCMWIAPRVCTSVLSLRWQLYLVCLSKTKLCSV